MKCQIEVTKFIDGDSFKAMFFCKDHDPQEFGVRIKGIDCPEMRGKCEKESKLARTAAQFTKSFLMDSELIEIETKGVGYYGRVLGEIFGDGIPLSKALIDSGLARVYGGSKRGWC